MVYKMKKQWKDSLSQVQKKAFWDKKKRQKGVGWEFEDEIDFFITGVENIFEKEYMKLFSNR